MRNSEKPPSLELIPATLINRSSRLLMLVSDARLNMLGLGTSQLFVLMALRDGLHLSQKQLAQRARVQQPTMAEMLRRMQRDGLVVRTLDPDDGRGSLFSLTKTALAKLPRAARLMMEGNDEALAGFSKQEVEALSNMLRRIVANLELVEDDL